MSTLSSVEQEAVLFCFCYYFVISFFLVLINSTWADQNMWQCTVTFSSMCLPLPASSSSLLPEPARCCPEITMSLSRSATRGAAHNPISSSRQAPVLRAAPARLPKRLDRVLIKQCAHHTPSCVQVQKKKRKKNSVGPKQPRATHRYVHNHGISKYSDWVYFTLK